METTEQICLKSKFIRVKSVINVPIAPKSRPDRSYGPEGQEFESLTACQKQA